MWKPLKSTEYFKSIDLLKSLTDFHDWVRFVKQAITPLSMWAEQFTQRYSFKVKIFTQREKSTRAEKKSCSPTISH